MPDGIVWAGGWGCGAALGGMFSVAFERASDQVAGAKTHGESKRGKNLGRWHIGEIVPECVSLGNAYHDDIFQRRDGAYPDAGRLCVRDKVTASGSALPVRMHLRKRAAARLADQQANWVYRTARLILFLHVNDFVFEAIGGIVPRLIRGTRELHVAVHWE